MTLDTLQAVFCEVEHIRECASSLDPDQPQLRGRGEAAGLRPLHQHSWLRPLPGLSNLQGSEVSLPAPVRGPPGIRGRGEDDEMILTVVFVILFNVNHVFCCILKGEDKKNIL